MSCSLLQVKGRNIVDKQGRPVFLRGVNLGGWLMMEAYFMHAPNRALSVMLKAFTRKHGEKATQHLLNSFRQQFIKEADIKQIASWGFNSLRVPVHYQLIDQHDWTYLDRLLAWAKKAKIYVIWDLHAAPGCQNHDWHSDSLGQARLWTSKRFRHQTYHILEKLANRYAHESIVAGYDVLNEAVIHDAALLNEFYREAIKAIRRSDKEHMLFIEGNRWAQQIDVLDRFGDEQWLFSIHCYEPLNFTFNFEPGLIYPLRSSVGVWDKNTMRKYLENYNLISRRENRPIHVGEFGVHYRQDHGHEVKYLEDMLGLFKEMGFHWHYWTYKAVKHFMFPDGILSYYPNSPWVNRPGPVSGWDKWPELWSKHEQEMIDSWQSKRFTINQPILYALIKGR